jgi:hypothetical protein
MVSGIDIFREHFSDFKDQYTVIGGFACDLLMTDAGLDFRQTVDIDMVLTVEALTTEFAKAFWEFIEQAAKSIFCWKDYVSSENCKENLSGFISKKSHLPFYGKLISFPINVPWTYKKTGPMTCV